MNEKALRKEIDEKIQGLTEENRKVYEDMLAYLRLSSINRAGDGEILLELLNHLLSPESRQIGRRDFYPDPKRLAQQIVGELPASSPQVVADDRHGSGLLFRRRCFAFWWV